MFSIFQSTLPRRERLSGVGKTTINDIISIHTPTKGATLDCNLSVSLNKFQSTLPQRERRNNQCVRGSCKCISIHTPTKGATLLGGALGIAGIDFNPHSHKGSDFEYKNHVFRMTNFNPHSHKGSDSGDKAVKTILNGISIHTPTKGATSNSGSSKSGKKNFNPHSHKGSDSNINQ